MRLTIAYSKIKRRNLVLINNDTYQRETLSERPIRQSLIQQFQYYINQFPEFFTPILLAHLNLSSSYQQPLFLNNKTRTELMDLGDSPELTFQLFSVNSCEN